MDIINFNKVVIISSLGGKIRILDKNDRVTDFPQLDGDIDKWATYLKGNDFNNFIQIDNRLFNVDYLKQVKLVDCPMYNEYSIVLLFKNKKGGDLVIDFNSSEEVNLAYNTFQKGYEEYKFKQSIQNQV